MKPIFLAALLMISCFGQRQAKENNAALSKTEYFRRVFVPKMPLLQLPCSIPEGKFVEKLILLDMNSQDTLFNRYPCYGILGDTSKYFVLVYYTPAASLFPNIETYDKNGESIDNANMNFNCWDGGPYEFECNGEIQIDRDFNIDLEHITKCFDCDSTQKKPIEYIDKGHGKIQSNGFIEFIREKNE